MIGWDMFAESCNSVSDWWENISMTLYFPQQAEAVEGGRFRLAYKKEIKTEFSDFLSSSVDWLI